MLSCIEVNLTIATIFRFPKKKERNVMIDLIRKACRTVALWISAPYVLGLESQVISQRREILVLETKLSATRTMLEYLLQHNEQLGEKLKRVTEEIVQVRELAENDPLTGLKNRRGGAALFAALAAAHLRVEPEANVSISLAAFDLDGFKSVNDSKGHDAGDVVLQQVSAILSEVFRRSTDVLVRTGGDEFVVIMLDTTLEKALQLAKAAVEAIARASMGVTSSAGVATMTMHRQQDTNQGLQALNTRADAALRIAKNCCGKNRVICAPGPSIPGA